MAALTLRNFADIIRDEKGVDYEQYFLSMFNNVNRDLNSNLVDYLEMITNDPAQWIDTFPTKLRALTALSKPKTAMLWALKSCEAVRNVYGGDQCTDLYKKVSDAWKNNKDRISEQRLMLSNLQTNASTDLENEGDDGDHVDAQAQINEGGDVAAISAAPEGPREGYVHVRNLLAANHKIEALKQELEELHDALDAKTKELETVKAQSEKRMKVINTLKLVFHKLAAIHYDKDDGNADIHKGFIDALVDDC